MPGRYERGADYLFHNPHNERAVSKNEAWTLVRVPRARFPVGNPLGWNFEALSAYDARVTAMGLP